jgi:hypothetical protein
MQREESLLSTPSKTFIFAMVQPFIELISWDVHQATRSGSMLVLW